MERTVQGPGDFIPYELAVGTIEGDVGRLFFQPEARGTVYAKAIAAKAPRYRAVTLARTIFNSLSILKYNPGRYKRQYPSGHKRYHWNTRIADGPVKYHDSDGRGCGSEWRSSDMR